MILRLASDEIEELRRALLSAYGEMIRELGRTCGGSEAGVQLCRRKWKLEAMLRALDRPPEPPTVLKMVPRRSHAVLEKGDLYVQGRAA